MVNNFFVKFYFHFLNFKNVLNKGPPSYDQLNMDEDDVDVINQKYYPMFPYVTNYILPNTHRTTTPAPPTYSDALFLNSSNQQQV
jgi:hypothetical protein